MEQTLGEIFGAVLQAEPDSFEGQVYSARVLARDIAGSIKRDLADVWDAMCHVPDNMLDLLHSPQGWMALASFIASDLGAEPPDYKPTKH